MQLCIYLELSPFPAIVANRIIAFTITGKGEQSNSYQHEPQKNGGFRASKIRTLSYSNLRDERINTRWFKWPVNRQRLEVTLPNLSKRSRIFIIPRKGRFSRRIAKYQSFWGKHKASTPAKFNIASEKWWLEDDPFLLGFGSFSGANC